MLEISPDLLAALGERPDREFIARLAQFVRERVPEISTEDPVPVILEVRNLVDNARRYGLTTEHSTAAYVITAAYLGTDFDQNFPAATAVLVAKDMSETAKADWLESWTAQIFEELG